MDSSNKRFRMENRLELQREKEGNRVIITIDGFLNPLTVNRFQSLVTEEELRDVSFLTIDLTKAEYLSSFGLRVFLSTQQIMDEKGAHMTVRNVPPSIMELFEMTGFVNILNIED